jgi:hypothetical protein
LAGDIAISTIDAFVWPAARFPLEAGVDPGFSLADDTEILASRRGARLGAADLLRARQTR